MLVALAAGCSQNPSANDNASAIAAASPTTTAGPDNSEITTSVDSSGTKTETRTFKNNPRISKVVVTTRDGRRTVRAYSAKGEEREVTTNENVLEATGDKVASAAGFVADKAEDVPGEAKTAAKEVGDKAEDVKDKTVSTTKKVGSEVGDKAEDVKDKTVSTTKKVGEKTVEGAKKVGSETKKAVKKVIP
jgi:transcriptional regulator of met regulon